MYISQNNNLSIIIKIGNPVYRTGVSYIISAMIIISKYIKDKELGKGASCISYIVESAEDWEKYAIKVVDKNKLSKAKLIKLIKDEIIIQKELNYEKIVKIKKYFEDNQNVYIVL